MGLSYCTHSDLEDLFDFLGAPPLGFVKINFDGSVRDGRDGTGYVVRGPNSRLLAAGGHPFLSHRFWE